MPSVDEIAADRLSVDLDRVVNLKAGTENSDGGGRIEARDIGLHHNRRRGESCYRRGWLRAQHLKQAGRGVCGATGKSHCHIRPSGGKSRNLH